MNGTSTGGHDDAGNLPTERTALLGAPTSVEDVEQRLPPIRVVASRVKARGIRQTTSSELGLFTSLSSSTKTAFILIVLLQVRIDLNLPIGPRKDVWEQWSQEQACAEDVEELDRRILETLAEVLESGCSNDELDALLWTEFQYERGNDRVIRVVDLLSRPDAPAKLLSHRVVLLSLLKTWSYGRSEINMPERVLRRFGRICPPRVVHAVDIGAKFAYMVILAHFLLYPPSRPVITYGPWEIGPREIYLLLYSAASLLRCWSLSALSSSLVLLPFLFCLPAVPYPGDAAFDLLLVAFAVQILSLHLPQTPSFILLFRFENILPLSTLLQNAVTKVFYPALFFFLPVLLVSSYLLSSSLSDTFLSNQMFELPAPMETRAAFFSLFIIILLMFISFIVLLTLMLPSLLSTAHTLPDPWDRYGQTVGFDARRIFVRAVVTYSESYFFPPPLNLIQFVFVRVPAILLYVVGKKQLKALRTMESIMWWIIVAPVNLVVAGVWLWGLTR